MADPDKIQQCQTLSRPGAYVVARNLSAAGDCLVVATSNVSIDLGGFNITGNGSGAGITDRGVPLSGITVRNGAVVGFANGINLASSHAMIIEGIRAIGNSNVGIFAGHYSLVRGNLAVGNGSANTNGGGGISVHLGPGFVGSSSTISDNNASGNPGNGIVASSNSTITGNTASNNGNDGIAVVFGGTLSNNTASRNGRDGLSVDCQTNLVGNTARDNVVFDVHQISGSGTCTFFNNLPTPP
jgi:parallel beta-helix repeat protein